MITDYFILYYITEAYKYHRFIATLSLALAKDVTTADYFVITVVFTFLTFEHYSVTAKYITKTKYAELITSFRFKKKVKTELSRKDFVSQVDDCRSGKTKLKWRP